MKVYGSTPELKSKQAAPNIFSHKISREISRVSLKLIKIIGLSGLPDNVTLRAERILGAIAELELRPLRTDHSCEEPL